MMFLGATRDSAVRARFLVAAHLLDGGYVALRSVADATAALAYVFTVKGRGYLQGEFEHWVHACVEEGEIATMISIGPM